MIRISSFPEGENNYHLRTQQGRSNLTSSCIKLLIRDPDRELPTLQWKDLWWRRPFKVHVMWSGIQKQSSVRHQSEAHVLSVNTVHVYKEWCRQGRIQSILSQTKVLLSCCPPCSEEERF